MTRDLFEASPMSALSAAIRGGLAPGQLGVVMARAGVGKSTFLVHVAISHLIRGAEVLHVSLHRQAAEVRSHYQEILSLLQGGGSDPAVEAEVERNRVVHSFLSGGFGPTRLRRLLTTLDEVMDIRPAVVIIDGPMEAAELDAAAWKALAAEADIRIWCALRTHRDSGPAPAEVAGVFDTAVALEPRDRELELCALKAGSAPVDHGAPLRLDPVTMLVLGGGPAAKPLAAPSPAPRTVTLVSGGGTGAECAFGEAAERWGLAEVNLTFDGHQQERSRGARTLTERELSRGAVSMLYVNKHLVREWKKGGPIARILQVQWHLVSQVKQLFVVGEIQDDGTVTGGTGWSVELAKRWNKTVWVYCQQRDAWHGWSGEAWVPGAPVIETTSIGATGTRYLTDGGRAAIEALFERSFEG